VDDCQRAPGLKCLLLRKVGKVNVEHFEDLRQKLFGRLKHDFSAHGGLLTFANGSRIIAGHFRGSPVADAVSVFRSSTCRPRRTDVPETRQPISKELL
jgi:hypothetical protein